VKRSYLALAGSLVLSCGLISNLQAEEVLFESLKIVAPDGAPFDAFGRSVTVEGDVILVGAPLDDDGNRTNSGSAYSFDAQSGALINKFNFGVPRTSGLFGDSVALAGGIPLIGTPNAFRTGAASTFINGSENILRPFSPSDSSPELSNFGFSVDLSSDGATMVIGARGDTGEPDAGANGGGGAMYIYTPGGTVRKVFASDANFADNFGHAVTTTNRFVVGSSPFDDDNGEDSGSIYVFDAATGLESFKIIPADSAAVDLFGIEVASAGSIIAASAPLHDAAGVDSGAVYLFDAVQGIELNKFTVPGSSVFGTAIAMDETHLAVTSREAVYVYDLATSEMVAQLRQTDPTQGDFFGGAIALQGDAVVVSAEGDATNGERSGAVYVYSLSAGNSDPVPPLPPTDPEEEASAVSVQSIEADVYTIRRRNGTLREGAEVTVVIANDLGTPVEGATVTVQLTGRIAETIRGITNADGSVVLQSKRTRKQRRRVVRYTATVVDVEASLDYDASGNSVTSASSR